MIGKTIFFTYRGEAMCGEVIDKIIVNYGAGRLETGYLVITTGGVPCKVGIDDIQKVIV